MSTFKYRVGSYSWKVDANTTKEELDRIKRVTGDLSPDNILNEASHKNNPIHDNFEWNNNIAGDKFRKQQARQLLGDFIEVTVEVMERNTDEPIEDISEIGNIRQPDVVETKIEKVFYSVKIGENSNLREYVTNDEIKVNKELQKKIRNEFKIEVHSLIKRYEQFIFMKNEIDILYELI